MEIEKLNDNKIKITLNDDDLQEYNLDFNSIAFNSQNMQEFFWNMMQQAECEFGFNLDDSHFFIEARTGLNNDLVIFVTKLVDFDEQFKTLPINIKKKKYRKIKPRNVNSFAKAIYKVDNFDVLCNAAKQVKGLYHGDSSLYKYNGEYYLVSFVNAVLPENRIVFDTTLREYTKRVGNDMLIQGMLSEYGTKLIDKNALDVVQKYFVN